MNVLHLCTKDHGGAGYAAFRLHRGLVELGVASRMLVMQREKDDGAIHRFKGGRSFWRRPLQRLVEKKIRSQFERYRSTRPKGLELFTDDRTVNRNLGLCDEVRRADIVHLHWIAKMVDYGTFFPQIKNKPVVWTLHDMNPFTGGCHYAGTCRRYERTCRQCPQLGSVSDHDLARSVWGRKQRAYKGMHITCVTPSNWLKSCAAGSALMGNLLIEVIPNGLPGDACLHITGSEARRALGFAAEKTVILFGGDDLNNNRKGAGNVIRALNLLKDRLNGHEYVVAAFGKNHESIAQKCRFKLHQLGYIPQEKMPLCYAAADVFVIGSTEDNLPNTVMESMACGTPVAGFDVGGIPDMVQHKRNGMLAAPSDIAALSDMVWRMASRPDERNAMSENAVRIVKKRFQTDIQSRDYLELYRRVMGDHRQ